MKKIRKRFLWLCFIAIFCLAVASTVINVYGKRLADRLLEQITIMSIEVKDVSFRFPFGINLHNVHIKDKVDVLQIGVQFGLRSLFSNNIHISSLKVIHPKIVLPKESLVSGSPKKVSDKKETSGEEKKENSVFIYKMNIHDGEIIFLDEHLSLADQFRLSGIYFKVNNFALPLDQRQIPFKWESYLSHPNLFIQKQFVKGEGWVDWGRKDMSALFDVIGKTKETLLSIRVDSINNNLNVHGSVQIEQLLSGANIDIDHQDEKQQSSLLKNLETQSLGVSADFSFQTKMDNFQLEKIVFSGNVETKNVDE